SIVIGWCAVCGRHVIGKLLRPSRAGWDRYLWRRIPRVGVLGEWRSQYQVDANAQQVLLEHCGPADLREPLRRYRFEILEWRRSIYLQPPDRSQVEYQSVW